MRVDGREAGERDDEPASPATGAGGASPLRPAPFALRPPAFPRRLPAFADGVFGPFAVPGFAGLWVGASAGSFARVATQLSLSWLAFDLTGSPFLVGLVLAARTAPQFAFGIPMGVLADRVDRRRLVILACSLGTAVAVTIAAAGAVGLLSLPVLLLATLLLGTLDTLRTASTQAYAYDVMRAARAVRGIALTNLGGQLLGALAGIVSGVLLERWGSGASFMAVAVAWAAGAAAIALAPRPAPVEHAPAAAAARPGFRRSMTLIGRNAAVRALMVGIVLAEIFGFASQTLFPTFARDIFEVGAGGLGTMTFARSVGGVLGLLLLAGGSRASGGVFLAVSAALGLSLALFAYTPVFALGLVLLVAFGATAAAVDSLGQTLIQRAVDERERGAAMGLWVFGVGCGPVGLIGLGAAADLIGARPTQAISGVALLLVALLLAAGPLRRVR